MKRFVIGTALVFCAASTASAVSYTFDFESYSVDNLAGQDTWFNIAGTPDAKVVTDHSPLPPEGAAPGTPNTQAMRFTGQADTRVGRDLTADIETGLYKVSYDFTHSVVTNPNMALILYPKGTTSQVIQPFVSSQSYHAFTATAPGATGYGVVDLIAERVFVPGQWQRVEFLLDFGARMVYDYRVYDISTGSKVLVAYQRGPTFFGNVNTKVGRIGLRITSTNTSDWFEVDNITIAEAPPPSAAPNLDIGADVAYANIEYKRLMLPDPIVAATYTVLSGPSATIDASNVLQGWTPTIVGTSETYEVQATNSFGSDTATWPVNVVDDLLRMSLAGYVNRGRGSIIDPVLIKYMPTTVVEPQPFARYALAGGGYYFAEVYPTRDRNGASIDVSNCQTVFSMGLRYFQGGGNTNPYGDAPVGLRLFSGGVTTAKRDMNAFLYQSSSEPSRYPNWIYKTVFLNQSSVDPYTDAGGFDATQVSQIELWGTDWAGVGQDFVDFKDIVISNKLGIYPNLDQDIAFPNHQYVREFMLNTCDPAPTWSLVTGPTGLDIDEATGIVTWTPGTDVVLQTYTVTIKATTGGGEYEETYQLTVPAEPPVIVEVAPDPGSAYVGMPYIYQPALVTGTAPVTWSKVDGPDSLQVADNGAISGWTPEAGELGTNVTITVKAENSAGSDIESWQVQVKAPPAGGDNVEPPWGTVNANLAGTQSSDDPALVMNDGWSNGAVVDWTLPVRTLGLNSASARGRISFDEGGNLYWKTADGFLASVSPIGEIRWTGHVGATPTDLGAGDTSSPVVGLGEAGLVYVTTDAGVAAFSKATGERAWNTALSGSNFSLNARLTPVLYQGSLYVMGAGAGSKGVYVLDAATGAILTQQMISGFDGTAGGQMAFVPNAFGSGAHGLYFNADAGSAGAEMYALTINESGAYLAWKSEGGKVARSHVIYLEGPQRVCTHTWNDYGAAFYCWNLDGSLPAATGNVADNAAHGFEDLGCVDFDGNDVLAGAFTGRIVRYIDIATPGVLVPPSEVVYDTGGFDAFSYGALVGQDNWANDTVGAGGSVDVIDDPTGGGHGKVIVIDPPGMGTGGTWLGVVRAVSITPGAAVTMEWDMWRADTNDNFWVADNAAYDGWWALGWDSSGTLSVANTFGGGIAMTPQKWQHVKYTFNPADGSVTLDLDGVIATAGSGDKNIAGIDFEVAPTDAGGEGGPMYIDNVVIKQGPAPSPPAFGGNGFYQMNDLYRENRAYGGLYKNQSGDSIIITGTSGDSGASWIASMNVTTTELLTALPALAQPRYFEWNTGTNAFPTGGPILGPATAGVKQHIYYFNGTTGDLVALTFVPPIPGDFNNDTYVDQDDYDLFVACVLAGNGPEIPIVGDCADRDLDGDEDIDQVDFSIWQICYSGTEPGNPDCATP